MFGVFIIWYIIHQISRRFTNIKTNFLKRLYLLI